MQLALLDDQQMIVDSAISFLQENSNSQQVRVAWDSPLGYSLDVWQQIGELGWCALTISEEYGGLSLSVVESVLLQEQAGRYLLSSPLFATIALALPFIQHHAYIDDQKRFLPMIARGDIRATACLGLQGGQLSWQAPPCLTAIQQGGNWILNGSHPYVLDGHFADVLIVLAKNQDEQTCVFMVERKDIENQQFVTEPLVTFDQGRRFAKLSFDQVSLPSTCQAVVLDQNLQKQMLDAQGSLLLAAEQVGGSQACLEMTLAYAQERKQFGRVIGSFQAVKHRLAQMMVGVEAARSSLYGAACVMAAENTALDKINESASSRVLANEHFVWSSSEAIQLHGGVGFTWEYDPHLYFKRAQNGMPLLCSPQTWTSLVAEHLFASGIE